MRKTLALSALAALSCIGTAQGIGTAEIKWQQHLTTPWNYTVIDTQRAPNGDFIFIGTVAGAREDLLVIRSLADGTPVWTKTFAKPGAPGDVVPAGSAVSNNGKIFIATHVPGATDLQDFYFLTLDANGNLLADRIVDEFNNDYTIGGMEALGNAVYFTASGLSAEQPLLVRADDLWNTVWTYPLGSALATGNQRAGGIDLNGGRLLASAVTHDGTQTDVQFVRIDPATGLLQWEKILGDAANNDADPSCIAGTDGNCYFTYTRSNFTVLVEGRLSKYDDSGVFQWNKVFAGIEGTLIAESTFGDIFFAGIEAESPYDRRFSRVMGDGTVMWDKEFTFPNLDFHDPVTLSVDSTDHLTLLSYSNTTGNIGGDWLVTMIDKNGIGLFEWAYNTGAGVYDIPTGMRSVASDVVVSGFSNFSSVDAHFFRLSPVLLVQPNSATVRLGRLNAGTVASLYSDDNDYYEVCKFIVPNATIPPVNVEFDSTVPADYPIGSISFETTVKANTPSLQQDTQLWDYLTAAWSSSTLTNLGVAEVSASIPGVVDRQVEGVTRNVKSRIRVKPVGPVVVALWCVQIDKVGWRVTP